MSGVANPAPLPARSPSLQTKPASKLRVTPRMKQALDLMVWENKTDNEAAVETGLNLRAIRIALKQPHVRSYYRGQLEVLRERESSRNIHTLVEVRDQKSNQMARVQAVKALEQLDDAAEGRQVHNALPGLQIVIMQGGAAQPVTVAGAMTIEHDDSASHNDK